MGYFCLSTIKYLSSISKLTYTLSMLKFIKFVGNERLGENPKALYLCQCGKETIKNYKQVKYLKIGLHCGCLSKPSNEKHGKSYTPIYAVWASMQQRCRNPKSVNYKNYGGRGITYSKSWEKFENFYKDMGETYVNGLELDRINNDGNYCKENCRWTTRKVNVNNRRSGTGSGYCKYITHNGKTQNLSDWAKEYGISREGMRQRHNLHGTVEL